MVVLDSSFLIAFHNSRDVHHSAAARAMDELIRSRNGMVSKVTASYEEHQTLPVHFRNHADRVFAT